MIAVHPRRRARRLAGIVTLAAAPLAVAALLAPAGPALTAADALLPPAGQEVDATIRAVCTTISGTPTAALTRARTVDVHVRGTLPLSATAGSRFTLDGLTTRFTLDPDVVRIQVEGTRGQLNARLDDLSLAADGASPNPAQVVNPKAPLDLGTKPVKIASAPFFDAPVGAPKATFDPVGPWAIDGQAGGVAVGLNPFTLTLTSYRDPTPTTKFAPVVVTIACKPTSPWFAKFPAYPAPQPAKPTITGLSPNIAGAGETVLISGTGLLGVTGVEFGGNPVPFKLGSDTQLQAVTPTINWIVAPPPYLQWDVSVTSDAGTSENTPADDFTYVTGTPAPPRVKAITPSQVPLSGGKVVVSGIGFKGTTSIKIGRLAAKFAVTSDSQLTLAAPAQLRAGVYQVTIQTPAGTETSVLRYR